MQTLLKQLAVLLLAFWTLDVRASEPVSFELDVQPLLTARGCSAGACHGKQRGQNGFQLSLLSFDPNFDYDALTKEGRGRRVFPAAPEQSLLLLKATAAVPHGGGERLRPEDPDYDVLLRWIQAGMPRRLPEEPRLTHITVDKTEVTIQTEESGTLTVTAYYSDGTTRDVTLRTAFQSNEDAIVAIDDTGTFRAGPLPGEATLMARYMYQIATCHVLIPLPGEVPAEVYAGLPRNNFVDEQVWSKLRQLGVTPSAPATDATFLRRAYIDIIGRVPNAREAREFLASADADKRERLLDDLLARHEYADHWASKWADLLRPNPYRAGIKAVMNFDNWIRQAFRDNKPYDQFVRELLTARGSTWENGATVLFRERRSPDELTTIVSQLFLGIRLECAKCHHHPSERWEQKDFYSFAAYFARVGRKGRGVSPPISGDEEVIKLSGRGEVKHPLTGEVMAPTPLFGTAPATDDLDDYRVALVDWMTAPDNSYFAKVAVNRVWADLMGRGLVDPVDDLRVTNPATNEPLLEALAAHFRDSGYDFKQLIKTIASSHVYSLSSLPGERNVGDTRNHSRYYRQRLRAEVLLDSVQRITGVPEQFEAMPRNSLAKQIWTHRVDSLFLDTFGRPNPNEDPPCERTPETAVTQTLHLMNSPQLHNKIASDRGRAAELAKSDLSNEQIIEELYLDVYARFPDNEEREIAARFFDRAGGDRRIAVEDLMWVLMNTAEFVFKT